MIRISADMERATGRILKSDDVRFEGRLLLDVCGTKPRVAKQAGAAREPTVRVVENNAEFAVVEITCSCGTKTRLRCDYAAAQSQ
jgi:hypothetical protein